MKALAIAIGAILATPNVYAQVADSNASLKQDLCNAWETSRDYTFGISCAILSLNDDETMIEDFGLFGPTQAEIRDFLESPVFDSTKFYKAISDGYQEGYFIVDGFRYQLSDSYITVVAPEALANRGFTSSGGDITGGEGSANADGNGATTPTAQAQIANPNPQSIEEELCDIWKTEGDNYMFGISCAITSLKMQTAVEDFGPTQTEIRDFLESTAPVTNPFDSTKFYTAISKGYQDGHFVVKGFQYQLSDSYMTVDAPEALAKRKANADTSQGTGIASTGGGSGASTGSSSKKSGKGKGGMMRRRIRK